MTWLAARAVTDEMRHAELCRILAGRYLGREAAIGLPTGVEAPRFGETSPRVSRLLFLVLNSCINESISLCYLREAIEVAAGPLVRAVLRELLTDEIDHARLGWAHLASASVSAEERRHVSRALPTLLRISRESFLGSVEGSQDPPGGHGCLDAARARSGREASGRGARPARVRSRGDCGSEGSGIRIGGHARARRELAPRGRFIELTQPGSGCHGTRASRQPTPPGPGGNVSCTVGTGTQGDDGVIGSGTSGPAGGGGGGGAFRSIGRAGGTNDGDASSEGGAGGEIEGNVYLVPLRGGCAGGRGGDGRDASSATAGAGRGAVQLSVAGDLELTGVVAAAGGGGVNGDRGNGGGGGGGGGIRVRAIEGCTLTDRISPAAWTDCP